MNTKPKRGRPSGSVSFATLTLAELNERFKPEDSIPVGRLFLEKGIASIKTPAKTTVPQPADTGPKVEMTLQD